VQWRGAGRTSDGAGQRSPAAGVDHAGAYLATAATKFPQVPTAKHDLQDPPTRASSTGCYAWTPWSSSPQRTGRSSWSASGGPCARGWLYLTVELAAGDRVRAGSQAARRLGLSVVDGEVVWGEPDGYYHYNPSMPRVREWLAAAGFVIEQQAEGPWQAEGYAYHHVLARLAAPLG
jgi:hypothetical protein